MLSLTTGNPLSAPDTATEESPTKIEWFSLLTSLTSVAGFPSGISTINVGVVLTVKDS
jgi:hypothetical protein